MRNQSQYLLPMLYSHKQGAQTLCQNNCVCTNGHQTKLGPHEVMIFSHAQKCSKIKNTIHEANFVLRTPDNAICPGNYFQNASKPIKRHLLFAADDNFKFCHLPAKLGKMSQNLSSAAVVIGVLRCKLSMKFCS